MKIEMTAQTFNALNNDPNGLIGWYVELWWGNGAGIASGYVSRVTEDGVVLADDDCTTRLWDYNTFDTMVVK